MPLLIIVAFIILFFWMIYTQKDIFNRKERLLQVQLGLIILILLIMLIIGGVGITFVFLLIWLAVASIGYYIYLKKNQKVGFILVNFCVFFNIVFLILQLWIYGTEY